MNPYSLCKVDAAADAGTDFDSFANAFSWSVPEKLNVADVVCHRHADGSAKLALIAENANGDAAEYTFDQIAAAASRLSSVMIEAGVKPGDRVAVILPQRVETALVHIAAHRIGAVSLPLSILFGEDALQFRLKDSGTKCLVVADERLAVIQKIRADLPDLQCVLSVSQTKPVAISDDGQAVNVEQTHNTDYSTEQDFWIQLNQANKHPMQVETSADDAAFLLYTSGTTGPPKGALIPHRALMGNLTGFECSHNGFPKANDVFFSPADWAWTGGLMDALLPAWFYGVPVVALDYKKFDAEMVVSLMSRTKVTCTFIPPTALKMMRRDPALIERYRLHLRSVMSAGETVGEALFNWGKEVLGVTINEMYGQTEHNYVIGNCSSLMAIKPGSIGKAYPGQRVAILGSDGQELSVGEVGEIAVHRHDPVHFIGYLNKPAATAKKYTGDWFHTGDMGHKDTDGYIWFQGRADDVISSAGYRIGPGEIENCALTHAAVLQAAAIGVDDPEGLRGEVVKLCVVLKEGVQETHELRLELQQHIKQQLAAYEYPRVLQFYTSLPMTTTGKVQRNVLREWHSTEASR